MKTKLIPIGNSKGIRIPKAILEQFGILDSIDLNITENGILVKPYNKVRNGWDEAFKKMALHNDDELLDSPSSSEWDKKEWKWE